MELSKRQFTGVSAAFLTSAASPSTPSTWTPLGAPPHELTLDYCLPTGQSFRWRQDGPGTFTGVIGQRLVRMCQTDTDCHYQVLARTEGAEAREDDEIIRDYFNLPRSTAEGSMAGVRLGDLSRDWAAACPRYAHIHPHIPGARMLRQPPLECLMQFICSSNNHISRIHGMVQRLCEAYGTPLIPASETDQACPGTPEQSRASMQADGTGLHTTSPPPAPAPVLEDPSKKRRRRRPTSSEPGQPPAAPLLAVDYNHVLHVTTSSCGDSAASLSTLQAEVPVVTDALLVPVETVTQTLLTSAEAVSIAAEPVAAPLRARGRGRAKRAAVVELVDSSGDQSPSVSALAEPQPLAQPTVALHYAFPTLTQLTRATEEELRAAGFGYRAMFITRTVQALAAKPGGGEAWLLGLRESSYQEAAACLEELPGVGPKVAACVCLFSLDKHDAIPVDTHVWQIATKYYGVKSKTLTKKVHVEVQAAFVDRFGPYAGWAHNALFISELAAHKARIPPYSK